MEVRLLIVDDEMQIRMGIERGIPWKNYGITQVFSAGDGFEALKIMEEYEIQILITDIRMPGMTGLELAQKAKECQPNIRIIILSGFSEFEYAKSAINIGVEDYLLKPIKIPELTKLITDVMEELSIQNVHSQNQRMQEVRENIEAHIASGNPDTKRLEQLLEEYTGGSIMANMICSVFDYDTVQHNDMTKEGVLHSYLYELCKQEKGMFLLRQRKKLILVACLNANRTRDGVLQLLKKGLYQMNQELKELGIDSITVGISQILPLYDIVKAVDICKELLNQRLYSGLGLYLDQPLDKNRKAAMFILKGEDQLRQAVVGYQYEQAELYIAEQFQMMQELKITSYDLVKGICLNLKQLLFSYIQETGLDVEAVLEKNKEKLLKIPDYMTLDQYRIWISDLYFLIIRGITEHSDKVQRNVIITALAYISTNYSNDITVDSISTYVKKSKNYFSYLFKKEMGISFVEYLNKYRVEEAKKLLDSSIDLTYEIAQKVGFRDEKYFSMVFKKVVGCSPSLYRKKKGV